MQEQFSNHHRYFHYSCDSMIYWPWVYCGEGEMIIIGRLAESIDLC